MTAVTWLHLSDWHQGNADFDRGVVLDALVQDIRNRKKIDGRLAHIDFVVFSGDIANHGTRDQYEAAQKEFFAPVLESADLKPESLFMVPGNHDLVRGTIGEMLPVELQTPLKSHERIVAWLTDQQKRQRAFEPFDNYRAFAEDYTGLCSADYAAVRKYDVRGKQVALLGLNSAWMCARNKTRDHEYNDYGFLAVGEPQVLHVLKESESVDLRIAVLHHPFQWLAEFDRARVEQRLRSQCHFILHGHEHDSRVQVALGTEGNAIVVPGGASYDRRMAANPRYTNGYSFASVDLDSGVGTVYLRRWSEKAGAWLKDIDSYGEGDGKYEFAMHLGRSANSSRSRRRARTSPDSRTSELRRDLGLLRGYLDALVRANAELEPGGIKQTKVQVILPLDEVYVGLQADPDRPDVDRRVLQEDLDEIRKRIEQVDDPIEREKQYSIFARQARVLKPVLEEAGERELLSNIVQRHRQVVVLGDPGAGKTTLVRYLAFRFARVIADDVERFLSGGQNVDGTTWRLPELGAVRLPILIRISHYAEARQSEPDLALVDYLPRHFSRLQIPRAPEVGRAVLRWLEAGRCLVLLDGLDEITNAGDRNSIAKAIGQFSKVYLYNGLPESSPRTPQYSAALGGLSDDIFALKAEKSGALPDGDRLPADNGRNAERDPAIVRTNKSERRTQQAVQEILQEAQYAHMGNRFVVTSRIAGYHFAGVPGSFTHYTIRRMSMDDIHAFLSKWCLAVERRIGTAEDSAVALERANREMAGIVEAIQTTAGVRRMAENPLLLRILCIIHRNEAHLPQRRVELYETAVVTLLRDWHLERGAKDAVIDDDKAMRLLGPLAFEIHETRASGLLSKAETERNLSRTLSAHQAQDPHQAYSPILQQNVREFLDTIREHSGLFVERGEGLYGFMHLTFEEYFSARHLISRATQARAQILQRLHLPRWREPILLAVGALSRQFYDDTDELLRAILEAKSPYESVLHRDLLFAAACIGDSVNVAASFRREVATRLLRLYMDRQGVGRYRLLQQQIRECLLALRNDRGDVEVEAALRDALRNAKSSRELDAVLEAAEWLQPCSPDFESTLLAVARSNTLPRLAQTLAQVRARKPTIGGTAAPSAWCDHSSNRGLARLVALLWYHNSHALSFSADGERVARSQLSFLKLRFALAGAREALEHNADLDGYTLNRLRFHVRQLPDTTDDDVLRSALKQVNALAAARGDWPGTPEEIEQLGRIVDEAGQCISDSSLEGLERAGAALLGATERSACLVPYFLAAADALELPLLGEESALGQLARTATVQLMNRILDGLRQTVDPEIYAALTGTVLHPRRSWQAEPAYWSEARRVVISHLEGGDATRRSRAMEFICQASMDVRRSLLQPDARKALLDNLENDVTQLDALRILLLQEDVGPELLTWCFSKVRTEHLSQSANIRAALVDVSLRAEGSILHVLETGRSDPSLRVLASGLISNVAWHGLDTLCWTIMRMADDDNVLSDVAALLFAEREDPFAEAKGVIYRLAEETTSSTEFAENSASDDAATWESFAADPCVLSGLTAAWNAWPAALSHLLSRGVPSALSHDEGGQNERGLLAHLRAASASATVAAAFRGALESCGATDGSHACVARLQGHLEEAAWSLSRSLDHVGVPLDGQSLVAMAELTSFLLKIEGNAPSASEAFRGLLHLDDPRGLQRIAVHLARHVSDPDESFFADLRRTLLSRQPNQWLLATTCILEVDVTAWYDAFADIIAAGVPQWDIGSPQGLSGLSCLLKGTEGARLLRGARAQAPEARDSFGRWLVGHLAKLEVREPGPAGFAQALRDAKSNSERVLSTMGLLASDVWGPVTSALLRAAQSHDDRTRNRARRALEWASGRIPTDGSSEAPEVLARFLDSHTGYAGTVSACALSFLQFPSRCLIDDWLVAMDESCEGTQRTARAALAQIRAPSLVAATALSDAVSDPKRSIAARTRAAMALKQALDWTVDAHAPRHVVDVLVTGLRDKSTAIRWSCAYALQAVVGGEAALALLRAAREDVDEKVRCRAILSLGRLIGAPQTAEADVSAHALANWVARRLGELAPYEDAANGAISTAVREAAQDVPLASEVLDTLAPISDEARWSISVALEEATPALAKKVGVLSRALRNARQASHHWHERQVFAEARREFVRRASKVDLMGHMRSVVAQVSALLGGGPECRRAAAAALAAIYRGEPTRPTILAKLELSEWEILLALTDAEATDQGGWSEEQEAAVKFTADWVCSRSLDVQSLLTSELLTQLAARMQPLDNRCQVDELDPFEMHDGWPQREVLVTVLAELSDRMTPKRLAQCMPLEDIVGLMTRAAADPDSYKIRSCAIQVLGNLQHFDNRVSEALFAAAADVEDVYRSARIAVSKFKTFAPNTLEGLARFARRSTLTQASHAVTLLGELGVSRSDFLDANARGQVAEELLRLLDEPIAQQIVYEFGESGDHYSGTITRIGPLYDVIYETLMQVIAGPDAPSSTQHLRSSTTGEVRGSAVP